MRTARYLQEDDRTNLMMQATEMYLTGEEERTVKGPNFEGRLYTEKRYELLGQFGGQRFDAELETAYGQDEATFLVNEQTRSEGPAFSRN